MQAGVKRKKTGTVQVRIRRQAYDQLMLIVRQTDRPASRVLTQAVIELADRRLQGDQGGMTGNGR